QPTTPPPAILPKLAWAATSTPEPAPSVNEGERLRLEAPVAEADALTDLTERWLLDDKEVGTGTSWEDVPGFEDGGQTRTGRVVASSQGSEIERSWRVTVVDVNRPPAIASVTPPEGKVALDAGKGETFALEASDPDAGDKLTYTWERNGKRVASATQPRFTLSDAADGDETRVTVSDPHGATAGPRTWKVALKAPPVLEPTPPAIVGQTPSRDRVSVEEGKSVDFSLKVKESDPKERFAYAWF